MNPPSAGASNLNSLDLNSLDPDFPTRSLTGNRQRVLEILRLGARQNRPATVREIAQQLGLSSPASVHRHLRHLEQMGLIERDPTAGSRNWHPIKNEEEPASDSIPLVGRIAAGEPIENGNDESSTAQTSIPIDPKTFGSASSVVALQVEGMSMRDAGIFSGDLAIVRRQPTVENGEIAAVTIDGEGTLKIWRGPIAGGDMGQPEPIGSVRLEAANSGFETMEIDPGQHQVEVFGKLVGIIRRFERH
ncbi:MAG: transcriptional repressor LexA [Planctomycetota bacterium]|nr:transcriptional repressor LexA [Planctomycetota bacterium]